ncbi:MAG: oligosaccharide flippase family protein [Planctomycetes bacterium]|nr:oligosaccharide flippase family protein [Planctomycetota bacterium]
MNQSTEAPTPRVSRLRPDTLAASVAVLLVANLVQRSVGFGRGVLFCRWLSPNELGTWDMAYSFLLLAAPVVVLGLPGCFGRYLERFRQRGQLRTFLRRASIWTASLTVAAVALLVVAAPQFSDLIFGQPDRPTMVLILAASLASVIFHHFLESLFAALRKFTIVSTMHFFQSMAFAALSLCLLWWWQFSAESVVVGYGGACLISAVGTLVWKGRALAEEVVPDEGIAHREFWPPLVRFAVWVWIANLLIHLFAVVDRYMLVHWSGLENVEALALVGQYHASRIVPLLFLSVADLLASVVMPYLSHDWETGARQRVSDRLNLILKFASLVMFAGGVVVLCVSPLLFRIAFAGRYDEGLAVMPWPMTYCVWYGLLLVAQNYLWCVERAKLATVPLVAGLAANIAINVALIPTWGLLGAVVSTTVATGLALAILYAINRRAGMQIQQGLVWLSLAPVAMCGGAWCGAAVLVVLAAILPFSKTLITPQEREVIAEFGRAFLARLAAYRAPRVEQAEAGHAI